MGISGIGSANTYTYKNVNKRHDQNKGTALFDRVGAATGSNSHRTLEQSRLTAYGAFCSMSSRSGNKISNSNLGVQVSKNLEAAENDKYAVSLYIEEGVKGHWRIYNKETGKTISFDPKYTSMQTDPETGKKYLTVSDWYGGLMDAWGVDSSLEEILKEFMGVDEIHCTDINDNFTLDRDAATGIVTIKRKGAGGNVSCMVIEDEEQAKKLEELAELYLNKYPSLVTSKEAAMTYARMEVLGSAVRDETGIFVIAVNGIGYMDAQDPTKWWSIMYSAYDSTIYSRIKEAFVSGAITGNMIGDHEKWVDWLTEKEIDFELHTTEEDLERLREENYSEWLRIISSLNNHRETISVQSQNREVSDEGQTKSEIVVKPDGARVLMITMSIGGMETVTSIEIFKPTDGGILGRDIRGDADISSLTENLEDNTGN